MEEGDWVEGFALLKLLDEGLRLRLRVADGLTKRNMMVVWGVDGLSIESCWLKVV